MFERSAVIVIFGLVASGCGLKGPLYLPEDKAQEVSAHPSENDEEKKRRTKSGNASIDETTPTAPTDTTSAPASTPPPNGN